MPRLKSVSCFCMRSFCTTAVCTWMSAVAIKATESFEDDFSWVISEFSASVSAIAHLEDRRRCKFECGPITYCLVFRASAAMPGLSCHACGCLRTFKGISEHRRWSYTSIFIQESSILLPDRNSISVVNGGFTKFLS